MKVTSNNRMSTWSRILFGLAAAFLVISIYVPMWKIDLQAPQYPEGLNLLIYPDKLGGNVEIINGLNHYIGMKTLNSDDFVEFKFLPKIIWAFAALCLLTSVLGRKKVMYALFSAFVLFGIVAMIDFYRWEYDYGHNLDPNAAIVVPGQAYQPPLIGFKQLLNFGAYSIPATGGWLFIGSGALMLLSVIIEWKRARKSKFTTVSSMLALSLGLSACSQAGPEPIKLNKDNCDYCRMGISDGRFAAELITDKGRVYKFDDIVCMLNYIHENKIPSTVRQYVSDFEQPGTLIEAPAAYFINDEKVGSPMGGNTAAFTRKEAADKYAKQFGVPVTPWQDVKISN
jgi:copper chaperone NosL